jgi:hypothetical protein
MIGDGQGKIMVEDEESQLVDTQDILELMEHNFKADDHTSRCAHQLSRGDVTRTEKIFSKPQERHVKATPRHLPIYRHPPKSVIRLVTDVGSCNPGYTISHLRVDYDLGEFVIPLLVLENLKSWHDEKDCMEKLLSGCPSRTITVGFW